MKRELTEIPDHWDYPIDESPLGPGARTMVNFLSDKVFCDYEPAQFHPFRQRLIDWLNNFPEELDQQRLLSMLMDTFFVGRREFEALYRSVFCGTMFRWVVSDMDVDIFASDMEKKVFARMNTAWICPISDSLRINSFLKVNGLKSRDKRPDWRSLRQFGDVNKVRAYVRNKSIQDLVLLEDFVGSGTQASGAVKFAANALPDTRILLCPLIVCPSGDQKLTEIADGFDNVTYDPALVLPKSCVHDFEAFEQGKGTEVERFFCSIKNRLKIKTDKEMFGFRGTGAKVVLFSNCPNNTLPIFHRETTNWKPLFPRVSRQ